MTRTYNLLCLSEAVSPITHMKGVSGNEALVMREPVVTGHGIAWVPTLSGNALRHRLIREPGARWLIDRWGLRGALTLPQLNYLFHGGNLTEGGGRESTRQIADMQRLFPLTRLLGGSLPSQILSGSLLVWRGALVCEENRGALASALPEGWEVPAAALRPAEAFVSPYQYTRGDAAKTTADLLPTANGNGVDRGANHDGSSNLMIFGGQSVTRGACFLHGFTLQHVGPLELGALLWSLRLWQQSGGTVGGQGARGHGRLQTLIHLDTDEEQDALCAAYVAYCDEVKAEAVVWLNEAFAARPAKEDKPKRKKAEASA